MEYVWNLVIKEIWTVTSEAVFSHFRTFCRADAGVGIPAEELFAHSRRMAYVRRSAFRFTRRDPQSRTRT